MSSLSQYQIKYLRHFLLNKYVRYKDVQLELIDHLASAIEELQEENVDLSFESALRQVEKGFGVGGFAKIVKEKEKALNKFWRREVWKNFVEFLKPPLLFVGIALFMAFYYGQKAGGFLLLNSYSLFTLISLMVLVGFCFQSYTKEDELNNYLFYKSYFGLACIILYFSLYILPSGFINFSKGSFHLANFPYATTCSSLYFTINIILIYILIIKIPSGLVTTMKKQHEKYASA